MPEARHDAWRTLGEHPLVEVEDGYAATGRDFVELFLKNPSVFSSKAAFDVLGSPVPLVPIAFDPPEQTRYRRILQPSSAREPSSRSKTTCVNRSLTSSSQLLRKANLSAAVLAGP
jgi:cytochrome P450